MREILLSPTPASGWTLQGRFDELAACEYLKDVQFVPSESANLATIKAESRSLNHYRNLYGYVRRCEVVAGRG